MGTALRGMDIRKDVSRSPPLVLASSGAKGARERGIKGLAGGIVCNLSWL